MDELINFGGALKSLDDKGRVGGYLVLFGSKDAPDFDGEFFTKETDFDITEGQKTSVYFNHRLPLKTRKGGSLTIKEKIGEGTLSVDEKGVLIDAVLFNRELYQDALDSCGWSSGTAPHLVDREKAGKAYHIKRWPLGLDASITPTPANPHPENRTTTLKSYQKFLEGEPFTAKGLLQEKLEARTPSSWEVDDGFRDVIRDIANAARSSKLTGVAVDVEALVATALDEYAEIRRPNIVAQINEYAEGSDEERFYLKGAPDAAEDGALSYAELALSSALKAGRRNSARDLELINRILRAAKELGAEEEEPPNADAAADTSVKAASTDWLLKSRLELADLELATLC